ncbi:MAG: ribonuclease H family protein [Candidatus Dormibacteria bacterium]
MTVPPRGDLEWVDAYSDGACSGNPGPGGWAFMIEWEDGVEEGSGPEAHTTNNRMELVAAREAMAAFIRRGRPTHGLRLHVDSRNVIGWLAEGWKRKANLDLFPAIDSLMAELPGRVALVHVRGHANSAGNNRVDELAVVACRSLRSQ